MSKIKAYQVNPDNMGDMMLDGQSYTSAGGANCQIYLVNENFYKTECYFNGDDYKRLQKNVEDLLNAFCDVEDGKYKDYTYKLAMEDNGILYNPRKCHNLKTWVKKSYKTEMQRITDYLSIVTGKKWDNKSFTGASQSDYCNAIYCTDVYTHDSVYDMVQLFYGCYIEFVIDDCSGYIIPDNIAWDNEKLIHELARLAGVQPGEIDVYMYDGYNKTNKYIKLAV